MPQIRHASVRVQCTTQAETIGKPVDKIQVLHKTVLKVSQSNGDNHILLCSPNNARTASPTNSSKHPTKERISVLCGRTFRKFAMWAHLQ